ncbi:MAG: DUF790 family protein [Deltaproteobacteria bacterium]|nr:DUF790 family protein [Deltaproteobacteria bacterium]
MLTADLVRARRRAGFLHLTPLKGAQRLRSLELAERYIALARVAVGQSRGEFDALCKSVPAPGPLRKIAQGLIKLITDRCEFETDAATDPCELRRKVFIAASLHRREAKRAEDFNRDTVLNTIAKEEELEPAQIDTVLYADLRDAQKLLAFHSTSPDKLVADYELAGEQAALLRAQRVVVDVEISSPVALRRIFHKLKFLRLLFTVQAGKAPASYRIEIDGPASIYRASTRYGLQLALALPVLRTCDRFALHADVLWGKRRDPLELHLEGGTRAKAPKPRRRSQRPVDGERTGAPASSSDPERGDDVSEEIATLLARFKRRASPWRAEIGREVLQLPGVGLCVPDLRFTRDDDETTIYLEVLGFWSREAVWKRITLMERGFPHRMIFAVSDRLRVSEEALGDDLPGAILTFKGVIQAAAIDHKLDEVAARTMGTTGDP